MDDPPNIGKLDLRLDWNSPAATHFWEINSRAPGYSPAAGYNPQIDYELMKFNAVWHGRNHPSPDNNYIEFKSIEDMLEFILIWS